jgi:hypothetical protein
MGMQATFHQITPQQLAGFLRKPRTAYDYVSAPFFENPQSLELGEKMVAELRAKAASPNFPPAFRAEVERVAQQFIAKSQAQKGPQLVRPESVSTQERKEFSLEKDWHVLHYALNGTHDGGATALADAILGGEEIPDLDRSSGYGPFRFLRPEQVAAVAAALAKVHPEELLSRLNYEDAEAKQIYLSHTLDDLADWDYLPELFIGFRDFYADAARSGNAMILSIT